MKRTAKTFSILMVLFVSFVTVSCQDTSNTTYKTVVQVSVPEKGVGNRSLITQGDYTLPGYYSVVLQSASDPSLKYDGEIKNGSTYVEFSNIFAGTYNLTVEGFKDETRESLVMTGSVVARVDYNSDKTFVVPIDVLFEGDGLKAIVSVDIDWTGTSKDIDTVKLFISDSPDSSSLDTWAEVAVQAVEVGKKKMTFNQEVPVGSDKFLKFLFFEKGQCIGYSIPDIAQLSSGQIVKTSNPSAYIYDDVTNPFRQALNLTDLAFDYDQVSNTAVLSWVNPHIYDKVFVKLSNVEKAEFVQNIEITEANADQYQSSAYPGKVAVKFNNLDYNSTYTLELFVQQGTGQESEHHISDFSTAVLVQSVSIISSEDLNTTKLFKGTDVILTANYGPSTADYGVDFTWAVDAPDIAKVEKINDNQAKLTALSQGKVVVTCTSSVGDVTNTLPVIIQYSAPTNLSISVVDQKMKISWADDNSGHDGHKVYQSNNDGGFDLIATIPAGTTSHTVESPAVCSFKVSSFGTIDNVHYEEHSEEIASVPVECPLISITLPTAPKDIEAVFSQHSGQTFYNDESLTIELSNAIPGATAYYWYLNGTLQELGSTQYEQSKAVTINSGSKGINLTQVNPMQDLMLVVVVNGVKYSSTLRFYMIDRVQLVDVSSITVNGPSSIVYGDTSVVLTANVLPYDASVKNVMWTSSDQSIATIDHEGKVTVHTTGSVIFTARSTISQVEGTLSMNCIVPVASVSVGIPSKSLIFVGGQNGYANADNTATVLSVAGANVSPTNSAVTWSSSDTAIATVDASSGHVTSVGAGTAVITAKTVDGGFEASYPVEVVDADLYGGKGYKGDGTDAPVTGKTVDTTGAVGNGKNYSFLINANPSSFDFSDNGLSINWNFEKDGGPTSYNSAGIRLRLLSTTGTDIVLNRQANAQSEWLFATVKDSNGTIVFQRKCEVKP